MIRPTILVFLISHALLPYVDSTSIPVNDEPSAGLSNVAPAKKSLRADKTMANEERVFSEWFKRPIEMLRTRHPDQALQKILLRKPEGSQSITFIETALQLKDMSIVLEKFKEDQETLLNAFTKHYGGFSFAISTLLDFENSEGPLGANAKKLLEMQLNIWDKKNFLYREAFNQLELSKEVELTILDKKVTYLERYIKRDNKDREKADIWLFETLEEGFEGRQNFIKLVTASIVQHGKMGLANERKSLIIGGRYIDFLTGREKESTIEPLLSAMNDIHKDGWYKNKFFEYKMAMIQKRPYEIATKNDAQGIRDQAP